MGTKAKTRLPTYMTADEFLAWNSGDETHYELVRGELHAMTSPLEEHGTVLTNIAAACKTRLAPPCRVVTVGTVVVSDETVLEPDALVTCTPPRADARASDNPRVVFEVASPSTEKYDLDTKLGFYLETPSLVDIVFVYIRERRVRHYTREGSRWEVLNVIGKGAIQLRGVGVEIPISELFENLAEPVAARPQSEKRKPKKLV